MTKTFSAEVDKTLKKGGASVNCGRKVLEIKDNGGHPVIVTDNGEFEVDKVLLSIGRAADLGCLGKLADQIKTERGKIVVDDTMKTSVDNIYACGDINGRIMLAHSAFKMGEVAAENALKGNHAVAKLNLTPAAIYTLPEVAAVGLTEEQAREKYDVQIGKFNFAANGRAIASDAAQGFVKVIADKKYGVKFLGFTLLVQQQLN